jgi:hypothetical protein
MPADLRARLPLVGANTGEAGKLGNTLRDRDGPGTEAYLLCFLIMFSWFPGPALLSSRLSFNGGGGVRGTPSRPLCRFVGEESSGREGHDGGTGGEGVRDAGRMVWYLDLIYSQSFWRCGGRAL